MVTCKLGSGRKTDNMVDHQLRVHGVCNLRVADASAMRMIPSSNHNASTLMIGEKAADTWDGKCGSIDNALTLFSHCRGSVAVSVGHRVKAQLSILSS
jgi:choline dehydrogenase-like flavoprotein